MPSKSLKLWWSDEVVNGGDVLTFLFGERKDTRSAANLMVTKMKANPTLSMSKREMRYFAKELQSGKGGVKYSYHNFYTKLLRKLLDTGFVEKNVLVWDAKKKKTASVYQLKLQSASDRAPQGGFLKHTWHIAKGWNELVQS